MVATLADRVSAWFAISLGLICIASPLAAAEKGPQRWALLIGVNDYAYCRDLQYCCADQEVLSKELVRAGFPADQVFLLHDKAEENKDKPFRESMNRQIDLVLGLAEPGDLVVVSFSGHGASINGKSWLLPTEARLDNPGQTMISLDSVYDRLNQSKATLKLLLVDACRNEPQIGGQRSATPSRATTEFSRSLEKPPEGILLLSSCATGQISMEDEKFGHGVFMHFVLEGLRGHAAGADGLVTLPRLYDYASLSTKKHVARKWNEYQTPALKGELSGPFELARVVRPLPPPSLPSATKKPQPKIDPALQMKLTQLTEKIRINPRDGFAYNDRGMIWDDLGEYDKAIADYTEFLRIKPNDPAGYNNLGLAWSHKGEYDKAIGNYNEAIRLKPTDAHYYTQRGRAWLHKGDRERAFENLDYAVTLAPQDDYVWNQRGLAWENIDEHDKALADHDQAIRINPKKAIYYHNRGLYWNEKHEYGKAAAQFGECIRLNPKNARAFNNRAYSWRQMSEYEKAIADCTESIRLDPAYTNPYNNRGWAWDGLGELDKAMADFNAAIQLDSNNSQGYANRAYIWAEKRDYGKALADCEEAIRLNPQNAWAYSSRAFIRFQQADYANSIAACDEAIRLNPKLSYPQLSRGRALEKLGNYEEAIAAYAKTLQIDAAEARTFASAALLRASCPDEQFRDGKKALALAQHAQTLDRGRNVLTLAALAAAHAELGDFDQAVKFQTQAIAKIKDETDRADAQQRLQRYRSKKPYRALTPGDIGSSPAR